MQPLKRIIYCIKTIVKSQESNHFIYHVSYYYLVQAVAADTEVALDESIYNKIKYPKDAMRFLEVVNTEMIDPTDSDYDMYDYLESTKDIKLFHVKDMVMYQLDEVHH